MTTWYHAVCDTHRTQTVVLITFNGRYSDMHGNDAGCGAPFLAEHQSCELRLVHRDDQLAAIDGYDEWDISRVRS